MDIRILQTCSSAIKGRAACCLGTRRSLPGRHHGSGDRHPRHRSQWSKKLWCPKWSPLPAGVAGVGKGRPKAIAQALQSHHRGMRICWGIAVIYRHFRFQNGGVPATQFWNPPEMLEPYVMLIGLIHINQEGFLLLLMFFFMVVRSTHRLNHDLGPHSQSFPKLDCELQHHGPRWQKAKIDVEKHHFWIMVVLHVFVAPRHQINHSAWLDSIIKYNYIISTNYEAWRD